MRIRFFVALFFLIGVFVLPAIVLAQNEEVVTNEEAVGNEDIALIGLGTVARIEPNLLMVSEYEYETDMEKETSYEINDKTEFDNIKSLADLKSGDSVEVVYVEEGGKKVALSVSKEEEYIDDDEAEAPANTVAPTETENVLGPEVATPGNSM